MEVGMGDGGGGCDRLPLSIHAFFNFKFFFLSIEAVERRIGFHVR